MAAPVPAGAGPIGGATAGLSGLASAATQVGQSANQAQQDIESLNASLFSLGRIAVAGGLFKLGEALVGYAKDYLIFGQRQARALQEQLVEQRQQAALMELQAQSARDILEALSQLPGIGVEQVAAQQELVQQAEQLAESTRKSAEFAEFKLEAHQRLRGPLTLLTTTAGILLGTYRSLLDYAVALNKSLEQANTSYRVRNEILTRGMEVMRRSGVAQGEVAEAARALVNYRLEESGSLGTNLDLMTKMNVALGVHYETSAKVATVYERTLGRGVQMVADTVARIAANTAIAAEKAADYAFHVARAVRLLGPGMRMESERITEVIANLAGRIQELGGDSETVLNLFQQMTSGTGMGLWLRGRAGVTAAELGTAGGAEAGLRGVARAIRELVTADPERQTELYLFQLTAAGEAFGMTAHQIRDLLDAVDALNKPLSQQATLEKAFREQQAQTAKSVEQLRNAWRALINQAFMPIYPVIRSIIDAVTGLLRELTGHPGALKLAMVGLTAAALGAGVAVVNLTRALVGLMTQTTFGQGALAAARGTVGGRLAVGGLGWLATAIRVSAPYVLPLIGGYLIGSIFRESLIQWPIFKQFDKLTELVARWYYGWKETATPSYTPTQRLGAKSGIGLLTEAAMAGVKGDVEALRARYYEATKIGVDPTKGAAWIEAVMPKMMAGYQQQERLSRLSLPSAVGSYSVPGFGI